MEYRSSDPDPRFFAPDDPRLKRDYGWAVVPLLTIILTAAIWLFTTYWPKP